MAIQQSVNQLLQTAQWASTLYAHQPNVQKKRADNKEYKSLSEEYDPKTTTTKVGREGVAAETGLTEAGYTPEEAGYKSIPYHQKDLKNIERLAELEKDPKKKAALYEAAGQTQIMIEEKTSDYNAKQAEIEEKKRKAVQASLDEKNKIEQLRQSVEQEQQYPKREVIKYGN